MTTDLIGLGDRADIILDIDASTPLTDSLIRSVAEVCDGAEDSAEAVVILRLADRSLPGTPETAWPGDTGVHAVNKWERVLRRLERLPAATIAVVQGAVGGPALELLLAMDYRIGTPDVVVRPPFLGRDPWPGMLLHRLSQQTGVAAARRITLFGSEISAERALHTGILDELAPADDLAAPVAAAAKLATGLAGSELAIRRRLVLDASTTAFEESLGAHLSACDRALRRARTRTSAAEGSAA
ncbi:enoyl-CoA hydratase/isomerase family protein [Streptomyces sp. NBC_00659]|uniref:enoyl-CoA-hydratase DpgB n=1 Tax=Streptomyces sp. NBC_00659 TaxID=2903669 RepID=UPI002E304892|nr:enoyl-CoA-hydratase DpgB [Streptomyces sp. NBC_00659]